MEHIFLESYQAVVCYQRRDKKLAHRLIKDLAAAGVKVWSGDYLKRESAYWASSRQQAIAQSNGVILLNVTDPVAVQTAEQHHVPIYFIWEKGALPAAPANSMIIDIRHRIETDMPLVDASLAELFLKPPQQPRQRLRWIAWNPLHQLRLLWWTFLKPRWVVQEQESGSTEDIRQTAGWLAFSLLFLPFGLTYFNTVVLEGRWRLLPSLPILVWLFVLGNPTNRRGKWFNHRRSMAITIALMVVLLPLLLWLIVTQDFDLEETDGFVLPISALLIGSVALALLETFRVTSVTLVLSTVACAFSLSMQTVIVAEPAITMNVESMVGSIGILVLLGMIVGIMAILVLYAFSFLIADDLIKALYTRNKPSQFARLVPVMLMVGYVLLLFA